MSENDTRKTNPGTIIPMREVCGRVTSSCKNKEIILIIALLFFVFSIRSPSQNKA